MRAMAPLISGDKCAVTVGDVIIFEGCIALMHTGP